MNTPTILLVCARLSGASFFWDSESEWVLAGADGYGMPVQGDVGAGVDPANWVNQEVLIDTLDAREWGVAGDLNIATENYGVARTMHGTFKVVTQTGPLDKDLQFLTELKFTPGVCT